MTDLHALAATARTKAQAISNSSPAIKAAALAQCDFDDAVANLLQPPPPSTSTRIGNGLWSDEQGDDYGKFTNAQNAPYGLILSGSDKSASFKANGQRGVIYHTVFEVGVSQSSTVWPNAVTEAQAASGAWIYKDSAGNLVKDSGGGNYICDPSIPGYQQAWIASVKAQCALGAVGVFIDNCAPLAWWGTRPYKNGVAVPDTAIADALMSFFTAFKAALPSVYLLPNIGAWDALHVQFAERACQVVDGVCIEAYTGSSTQQGLVTAIQQAGRDPWCLMPATSGGVTVTGSSAPARAFSTAFASVWDRKGGGIGLAVPEPVNTNWTQPVTG